MQNYFLIVRRSILSFKVRRATLEDVNIFCYEAISSLGWWIRQVGHCFLSPATRYEETCDAD